jgi:hypothetical protein
MEREPDGRLRRVGPLDAVAAARRNQEVIARAQRDRRGVALEAEAGAAAQQDDPLVAVLLVPAPGRRRVAPRDDALEAERRRLEERLDELLGERRGQARKEVLDDAEDSTGGSRLRRPSGWGKTSTGVRTEIPAWISAVVMTD